MDSRFFGILTTIVVNACILCICMFSGLKYIYPPPEETGVLMEFEQDEEPPRVEVTAGIQPRSQTPNPSEEVNLVQRAQAQEVGKTQNEAVESTVGDAGDVEIPEPVREKPINQRALFSAANNNKKDTLAPQVADRVSNALKAGHAAGNTDNGQKDGQPNAQLEGRTVNGTIDLPAYEVQMDGKVVVRITVNRAGKVTSAVAGAKGTTVTNKELWNAAVESALKAHFNTSETAPESQTGTITYSFTFKR